MVRAYIIGNAVRPQSRTCHRNADLIISHQGQKTLPLLNVAVSELSIIDFSPDGQRLLLESYGPSDATDENYRNELITVVGLAQDDVKWVNAWDLFHWGHCQATVEPQGFTNDGRVLILARPSNLNPPSGNDCVHDWGLYATDLKSPPVRLPDNTKVPRFGKVVAEQVQACKTDPDIVYACFTLHGRLSAWNGSPTFRIWKVGTNRILGDHDDWPLPEELAEHMNWDVEAWGDFKVCPFTKEQPGIMQMVCIESASQVLYKNR